MAPPSRLSLSLSRLSQQLSTIFPSLSPPLTPQRVKEMMEDGVKSHRFRSLCFILLSEIDELRGRESGKEGERGEKEFQQFLEKKLRELGFVDKKKEMESVEGRVKVVRFLCCELQMEQMLKGEEEGEKEKEEDEMMGEGGVLDELLNKMIRDLRMEKDLSTATPLRALREVRREVEQKGIEKRGKRWLKEGEVEGMSEKEKEVLREVAGMMEKDYSNRHQVLKKRAAVTMQSFLWCDKGREHSDEINNVMDEKFFEMEALVLPTIFNLSTAEGHLSLVLLESTCPTFSFSPSSSSSSSSSSSTTPPSITTPPSTSSSSSSSPKKSSPSLSSSLPSTPSSSSSSSPTPSSSSPSTATKKDDENVCAGSSVILSALLDHFEEDFEEKNEDK